MIKPPETALPPKLLESGRLRGNEWAWPICDIPDVIEAARLRNLLSIGGQLQFRFPEGTCELYWIEVNTSRVVPSNLPWRERVEQTAAVALSQFQALQAHYDFLAEGQSSFGQHLQHFRAGGGDMRDAMCFVWYLKASAENLEHL
jgi:hypothetical protein